MVRRAKRRTKRSQTTRTTPEPSWLGDHTLELAAEAEGEELAADEASLLASGSDWRDQLFDVLSRGEVEIEAGARATRPAPDADEEWLERQRRVAHYQRRVAQFGSIWEPPVEDGLIQRPRSA